MRIADFSTVENQVKPRPCNQMYNHALAICFDKSKSSRLSSIWELANNNILNTIPIGMASYYNPVLKKNSKCEIILKF